MLRKYSFVSVLVLLLFVSGCAKTHEHIWDSGAVTQDATCSSVGVRTYTCTECKETKTESIDRLPHSAVTDPAVEATCVVPGLTEGSHCSVCGEVISMQRQTDVIPHDYEDAGIMKAPTCTEEGERKFICSVCGDEKTEPVEKLPHKEVLDKGYDATCTEEGLSDGYHCSVCSVVTKNQTAISAMGHSYKYAGVLKASTCLEEGERKLVCSVCGDEKTEPVGKLAHKEVLDKGYDATCTEEGLSDGYHCSVCGTVTKKQAVINVKGHSYLLGKCSVCGQKQPNSKISVQEEKDKWGDPTGVKYIVIRINDAEETETGFNSTTKVQMQLVLYPTKSKGQLAFFDTKGNSFYVGYDSNYLYNSYTSSYSYTHSNSLSFRDEKKNSYEITVTGDNVGANGVLFSGSTFFDVVACLMNGSSIRFIIKNSWRTIDAEVIYDKSEIVGLLYQLGGCKVVGHDMVGSEGKVACAVCGISPDMMVDLSKYGQKFMISNTEATYGKWYEVKQWALSHGYSFSNYETSNPGREGNDGTDGAFPTSAKNEPVTRVSWRDAIVWCNALSEMSGLTPVYYTDADYTTPLRTSTGSTSRTESTAGSQDCPYIYCGTSGNTDISKCTSDGYRLPSSSEWEIAAKADTSYTYVGSDKIDDVAWYGANSGGKTHDVGTKKPNAWGLYDMSGNVWEWCWDWYSSSSSARVGRGGSWSYSASYCAVSYVASRDPYSALSNLGFRPVRSVL